LIEEVGLTENAFHQAEKVSRGKTVIAAQEEVDVTEEASEGLTTSRMTEKENGKVNREEGRPTIVQINREVEFGVPNGKPTGLKKEGVPIFKIAKLKTSQFTTNR
jgi:hypothetical protein